MSLHTEGPDWLTAPAYVGPYCVEFQEGGFWDLYEQVADIRDALETADGLEARGFSVRIMDDNGRRVRRVDV